MRQQVVDADFLGRDQSYANQVAGAELKIAAAIVIDQQHGLAGRERVERRTNGLGFVVAERKRAR